MQLRMLAALSALLVLPVMARANQGDEAMAQMTHHYFAGKWDCTGKVTNPHTHHKFDTVGRLKIKLKGHGWAVDQFENHAGDGKTYASMGWTHYDDLTKKLHRYSASNMGSWGRFVTDGWQGDDFVWTGKMYNLFHLGHEIAVTETIHKQSQDAFDWKVTVNSNGNDYTMYTGSCTRHACGHDKPTSTPDHDDSDDENGDDEDGDDGEGADETESQDEGGEG